MDINKQRGWQRELRESLRTEAFNEKHKCFICGRKEKLHIHHLVYTENKEDFFDPRFWRMLCVTCHANTPKGNSVKKVGSSKIISFCDYCGKKIKHKYKRKYCEYCLLVYFYKWSHEEYIERFGG